MCITHNVDFGCVVDSPMLVAHALEGGTLRTGTEEFAQRVGQVLQLIVATQEYQFA